MEFFSVEQCLLGHAVTARVQRTAGGISVLLTGGTHEHIGAVSVVLPEGEVQTMVFAAHRDDVISYIWADGLKAAGFSPAVIMVGIHYDNVNKEKIEQIICCTNGMLQQVLKTMQKKAE